MMERGVISDEKHLKVLQSIVVLDPVPMVNVFSGAELSPNARFHDATVLKHETSAVTN